MGDLWAIDICGQTVSGALLGAFRASVVHQGQPGPPGPCARVLSGSASAVNAGLMLPQKNDLEALPIVLGRHRKTVQSEEQVEGLECFARGELGLTSQCKSDGRQARFNFDRPPGMPRDKKTCKTNFVDKFGQSGQRVLSMGVSD